MVTRRRARPIFVPPLRAYEVLAALHVAAVFLLIRWVAYFDVSLVRTLLDQLPFLLTITSLTVAGFLLRTLLVLRRDGRARAGLLLQAGTRPTVLVDTARFVVFTMLAAHGYTWLKIFLPLLNPALHDAGLARMDAALHFGLNVNRFVIELLPFSGLWRLIDGYYMFFLATILGGLGWFASALSLKERARLPPVSPSSGSPVRGSISPFRAWGPVTRFQRTTRPSGRPFRSRPPPRRRSCATTGASGACGRGERRGW